MKGTTRGMCWRVVSVRWWWDGVCAGVRMKWFWGISVGRGFWVLGLGVTVGWFRVWEEIRRRENGVERDGHGRWIEGEDDGGYRGSGTRREFGGRGERRQTHEGLERECEEDGAF